MFCTYLFAALKNEYYFNSFLSILKAFEKDNRFDTAFYVGKNVVNVFKALQALQ